MRLFNLLVYGALVGMNTVCLIFFHGMQSEGAVPANSQSDENDYQCSSAAPEISNCTSGNSENWMVLSVSGDKPTPRFNVCFDRSFILKFDILDAI